MKWSKNQIKIFKQTGDQRNGICERRFFGEIVKHLKGSEELKGVSLIRVIIFNNSLIVKKFFQGSK
jgi:hypothetical protein